MLLMHLHRCDDLFVPRLSERMDLDLYAEKIIDYSNRFEAWHKQELIGLVAAYTNDHESRIAYITNVSVLLEWQGQGIASRLLSDCMEHSGHNGFDGLVLEVHLSNMKAIALYQKLGFEKNRNAESFVFMTKKF